MKDLNKKMQDEKITVSVICLVYNHSSYLRQCLNGIINQKTNFNIEVIVNDDASVDNSKEIIKEFYKKYPNIITPIFHKENEWGKGVDIIRSALKYVSGKYVAICDGDDYWSDEYKLQTQFDFMEGHKDCSLCAHKMLTIDALSGEKLYYIPSNRIEKKEIYTAKDFLQNGYFIQTTSYFVKNDIAKAYISNTPKFCITCPAQDTALILYCIAHGNIGYIDKAMGVYRYAVKNSWSYQLKENKAKNKIFYERLISSYEEFNEYTGNKYSSQIQHAINYMAVIGECRNDLLVKGDLRRRKKYKRKEKLKGFALKRLKFLTKIWYKRQLKEPNK